MSLNGVPRPGAVLAGKYLIEGLLGTGGMGVVLAARHQQLDQKVAIKLLLEEARNHPEVVERFSREARAAAKIQGEHVARVIDVGVLEDGAPYMVMEHLDGRDLSAELRARGPLPVAEVVRWILEACEAIAQAHAAKIVHRDLKPGNLFLARQPDGQSLVKVLDFGISKSVDPDAPALTKTSSLVGTPYYMAPEQLRASKSVDIRADIWALGVIMYELIGGAPPFDGTQMPEIVAAILMNQPTPLDTIHRSLPNGLWRVIERCMKSSPTDRYSSVAAVAAALAPFAGSDQEARVRRISRVLGVVPDEEPSPDTEAAPVQASSGPPIVSGVEKTMLLQDAGSASKGEPPLMSALATTKAASDLPSVPVAKPELGAAKSIAGVATSSAPLAEDAKPKTAKLALIAVLALALGGGGVFALSARSPSPATKDTSATATNLPSSTASVAPVDSSATSGSADPTPKAAGVAIEPPPALSQSSAAAVIVKAPVSVRSAPKPLPAMPASASAARVPAPSATTPPAAPSKNPLDMGIK